MICLNQVQVKNKLTTEGNMSKIFKSLVSSLFCISIISACSDTSNVNMVMPEQTQANQTINKFSLLEDAPVFSKRELGTISSLATNSIGDQKKKQLKLHTFYFKCYSNGSAYSVSDGNAHMKMLNEGASATGIDLDANGNGSISMDEISKLVTSDAYIKFFRQKYINFSFQKLDKNQDSKLSVDEYNQFNTVIKAKEIADFQLLEEFAEHDYNSSRNLDLEEYEDFFMKYLLIKYGATK